MKIEIDTSKGRVWAAKHAWLLTVAGCAGGAVHLGLMGWWGLAVAVFIFGFGTFVRGINEGT